MKLYNICLSYFVDNENVDVDFLPPTIKEDLLLLRRLKNTLDDLRVLRENRENKLKDLDELEAVVEVLIIDCGYECDVYSCLCEYQIELDIDMKLGALESELNLVTSNILPHLSHFYQ